MWFAAALRLSPNIFVQKLPVPQLFLLLSTTQIPFVKKATDKIGG